MTRSLVLTALLALSVCACGRGAPPPQGTAATAPPQQTQAATAQQTTTAAQPASAGSQNETAQATAAQESAGDSGEEDRGQTRSDLSLERLAALPQDAQLPSGRWKPGVNYDPLVPVQPTDRKSVV